VRALWRTCSSEAGLGRPCEPKDFWWSLPSQGLDSPSAKLAPDLPIWPQQRNWTYWLCGLQAFKVSTSPWDSPCSSWHCLLLSLAHLHFSLALQSSRGPLRACGTIWAWAPSKYVTSWWPPSFLGGQIASLSLITALVIVNNSLY
jgi:hypothetical protein